MSLHLGCGTLTPLWYLNFEAILNLSPKKTVPGAALQNLLGATDYKRFSDLRSPAKVMRTVAFSWSCSFKT